MVPMGDWRVPVPNPKIGFTENSDHGASGKGSTETGDADSGMKAEVVVIPNVGKEQNAPKEWPSQNA